MNWILVVGTAWPLTAGVAAVILGRAIRLADRRAPQAGSGPNFVVDPAYTVA